MSPQVILILNEKTYVWFLTQLQAQHKNTAIKTQERQQKDD